MKQMIKYGLTLATICMIATGLLAVVNSFTKAQIEAQAQTEQANSLKEVMPDASRFEPVKTKEEIDYYKAYADNNTLLGTAFKASAKGYSSLIETLVGMKTDGTIIAVKILAQNETPGLGTRTTEPAFTGQFKNQNINNLQVQAITGATISSKAVIGSVMKKGMEIKQLRENDK